MLLRSEFQRPARATNRNHGNLPANEIGRQRWLAIKLAFRPPVGDRQILALDITGFF